MWPEVEGYRIVRALGTGGMGSVHEAEDVRLARRVAIKTLHESVESREDGRARFVREGRVLAGLSHPNLVGVHEVVESGGRIHLVMEFVDGVPLDEGLRREHAGLERRVAVLEQVARAIHHAHGRGVVHRDLKPSNILLDGTGRPRIVDFGLARVADSTLALTGTVATLGTPRYMAPEQVRGASREATPRTDVFALGVVLYEVLTGKPPFDGVTPLEVFARVAKADPVPPSRIDRSIPRPLEAIVLQALEKEPARRQASAEAFADDLRRFLGGERVRSRPPSRWRRLVQRLPRPRARRAVIAAALIAGAAGLASLAWTRPGDGSVLHPADRALLEGFRIELEVADRAVYSDAPRALGTASRIERSIDEIVSRYPTNGLARFVEGRVREHLGDPGGAAAAYRIAVDRDRTLVECHLRLARVLLAMDWLADMAGEPGSGEREEAARHLDAFLSLTGDSSAPRGAIDAELAFCRGDADGTRRLVTAGLEGPRYHGSERLAYLAGRLAASPEEAEAAFTVALGVRPGDAMALAARGLARHAQGRDEDAGLDLSAALGAAPPDSPVRSAIARLGR